MQSALGGREASGKHLETLTLPLNLSGCKGFQKVEEQQATVISNHPYPNLSSDYLCILPWNCSLNTQMSVNGTYQVDQLRYPIFYTKTDITKSYQFYFLKQIHPSTSHYAYWVKLGLLLYGVLLPLLLLPHLLLTQQPKEYHETKIKQCDTHA